ncbi:MAG: hypothetical protein C4306_07815, partial [Thermoleophilia bacterium]
MPTPPSRLVAAALAVGVAGGVAAFLLGGESGLPPPAPATAAGWRAFLPQRGSSFLGQRAIVLLAAPSLADRVREAGGLASDAEERAWTSAALVEQDELLRRLASAGVRVAPERRFLRVVNGFSAVLDSGTQLALERTPGVAGVFPARPAYLATLERSGVPLSFSVGLSPFPGRGVTIGLLDTGVARSHPLLGGRVLPGVDLVDSSIDARPRARPGHPASRESHGTALAGILVGRDGQGEPIGLAPEATVFPIRVAGWQRDAAGRWSQYARADQIVAGLERAVDPNHDGDAHDAVRVALVGVADPGGSFADGPLAQAVEGAQALGTVVVAPAGNGGGRSGVAVGTVASPGGAPAALAVGAADLRPWIASVPASFRVGLKIVSWGELPLLSAAEPEPATMEVVSVLGRPLSLVTSDGLSRVAGRAALVFPTGGLEQAVAAATRAGAALVLVAGGALPASALGLAARDVPVLAAPSGLASEVEKAALHGRRLALSVGRARRQANPELASVAPFSSTGPGLAGQPKPDVVAPGVGLVTVAPLSQGGGLVTASGSSAA